jgi:hypothetical protein
MGIMLDEKRRLRYPKSIGYMKGRWQGRHHSPAISTCVCLRWKRRQFLFPRGPKEDFVSTQARGPSRIGFIPDPACSCCPFGRCQQSQVPSDLTFLVIQVLRDGIRDDISPLPCKQCSPNTVIIRKPAPGFGDQGASQKVTEGIKVLVGHQGCGCDTVVWRRCAKKSEDVQCKLRWQERYDIW